jgi:hypothetical protein
MTTFKEISGQLIRTLSSDPANPQEGQIWYNSTIGVLKGYDLTLAAWASGGNLGTGRYGGGSAGTQTEALYAGGYGPVVGSSNATEEYNGTSWGPGGNIGNFGFGTQTVAVMTAGELPPTTFTNATEEYDGSTWTTVNPSNLSRKLGGSAGIQTAGLIFGGIPAPSSIATESYDGTSWTTTSANLATARQYLAGCGTQTLALAIATNPLATATEEFTGAFLSTKTLTTS